MYYKTNKLVFEPHRRFHAPDHGCYVSWIYWCVSMWGGGSWPWEVVVSLHFPLVHLHNHLRLLERKPTLTCRGDPPSSLYNPALSDDARWMFLCLSVRKMQPASRSVSQQNSGILKNWHTVWRQISRHIISTDSSRTLKVNLVKSFPMYSSCMASP